MASILVAALDDPDIVIDGLSQETKKDGRESSSPNESNRLAEVGRTDQDLGTGDDAQKGAEVLSLRALSDGQTPEPDTKLENRDRWLGSCVLVYVDGPRKTKARADGAGMLVRAGERNRGSSQTYNVDLARHSFKSDPTWTRPSEASQTRSSTGVGACLTFLRVL